MTDTIAMPYLLKNPSRIVENSYATLASDEAVQKTMLALKKNGIDSFVFNSDKEVRKKISELIPEQSEVMNMRSLTLETLGADKEIMNSGKYNSVRNKLKAIDQNTKRILVSVPDYSIGSVHAVTETGEILIASATGSQLAAYAYGSGKVIWVVGTQKIVKDQSEGMKRIKEYCLPLEDERAKKAYNQPSKIGKTLIIASETPGRLTLLFIKQKIGF